MRMMMLTMTRKKKQNKKFCARVVFVSTPQNFIFFPPLHKNIINTGRGYVQRCVCMTFEC